MAITEKRYRRAADNPDGDAVILPLVGLVRFQYSSVAPTIATRSISGRQFTRQFARQLFQLRLEYRPMSPEEAAPLVAMITAAGGQLNPILLDMPQPVGETYPAWEGEKDDSGDYVSMAVLDGQIGNYVQIANTDGKLYQVVDTSDTLSGGIHNWMWNDGDDMLWNSGNDVELENEVKGDVVFKRLFPTPPAFSNNDIRYPDPWATRWSMTSDISMVEYSPRLVHVVLELMERL